MIVVHVAATVVGVLEVAQSSACVPGDFLERCDPLSQRCHKASLEHRNTGYLAHVRLKPPRASSRCTAGRYTLNHVASVGPS